jgi:peptidoglycan/LPS O-acetylase OafA/YrhL
MRNTLPKSQTLISIQLLRALAAFMVAYFHSTRRGGISLLPSAGSFGVDVFFVISGFVIAFMVARDTHCLLQSSALSGEFSDSGEKKYRLNNGNCFLVKRLFRIVPLYITATFLMAVTYTVFPDKINHTVVNIQAFVKSILFIPYEIETEFEPSGPVLGQGWTLNYEMVFYLIRFACIKFTKNGKYANMVCASVLAAVFLLLNIINSNIFALNYYRNGLFPEFIYGIALYYAYNYFNKRHTDYLLVKNPVANLLIFGAIGIVSFLYLAGDEFYNWHSIHNRNVYWGIPSLLLVFALLNLENQINTRPRFAKICKKLGDASYALYLFHAFISMFFTRILFVKIIGNNSKLIISIVLEIITMLATVLGSVVIYETADKPIQKYSARYQSGVAFLGQPHRKQ